MHVQQSLLHVHWQHSRLYICTCSLAASADKYYSQTWTALDRSQHARLCILHSSIQPDHICVHKASGRPPLLSRHSSTSVSYGKSTSLYGDPPHPLCLQVPTDWQRSVPPGGGCFRQGAAGGGTARGAHSRGGHSAVFALAGAGRGDHPCPLSSVKQLLQNIAESNGSRHTLLCTLNSSGEHNLYNLAMLMLHRNSACAAGLSESAGLEELCNTCPRRNPPTGIFWPLRSCR